MIKKMADPKKNKKFTLISFQNLSFFCEAQKETFWRNFLMQQT